MKDGFKKSLRRLHQGNCLLGKLNQNAWLKPYIDMNTDKKKAKNDFENDFFKLMKNAVFENLWKMLENIEILNLSQQKEEETIWCQNQMIPSNIRKSQ